jgi:hypothetical protein
MAFLTWTSVLFHLTSTYDQCWSVSEKFYAPSRLDCKPNEIQVFMIVVGLKLCLLNLNVFHLLVH